MEKRNTVFNPINFLRVVATLMVFCLHTSLFSSQRGFVFNDKTWFLQTPAWGAVWIFFLISGYLIGKGFFTGRYQLNLNGIISFILGRFFKIALPTLFFIFLCCTLIQPDFIINNPIFLQKIFTLSYDGNPGFDGVSATWYICTLLGLYLLAPILFFILNKIEKAISRFKHKKFIWSTIVVIIIAAGLILRLIALKQQLDWSSKVYVPFYMNLDIFICGMIFNYLIDNISFNMGKLFKIISMLLAMLFIVFNIYIYYKGYLIIYQYILPSVYIIIFGIYIVIFDQKSEKHIIQHVIVRKIIYLINIFSNISFGFYLFHSLILSRIYMVISATTPYRIHLKLLFWAFVVTLPFAYWFTLLCKQSSLIATRIANKLSLKTKVDAKH